MSHQIIVQPDGKYSIFSTVVDGFIFVDATRAEIIDFYVELAKDEARRSTERILSFVEDREQPRLYGQFTLTYEEAKELHDRNW